MSVSQATTTVYRGRALHMHHWVRDVKESHGFTAFTRLLANDKKPSKSSVECLTCCCFNPLIRTLKPHSNKVTGTLAIDGWAVMARRGLGGAGAAAPSNTTTYIRRLLTASPPSVYTKLSHFRDQTKIPMHSDLTARSADDGPVRLASADSNRIRINRIDRALCWCQRDEVASVIDVVTYRTALYPSTLLHLHLSDAG